MAMSRKELKHKKITLYSACHVHDILFIILDVAFGKVTKELARSALQLTYCVTFRVRTCMETN